MSSYIYLLYPLGLAVISGITGLIISFRAASYLGRHTNTKIDYWDVRFHGLKYLKQYRELTIKENGKPGGLYAAGVVAFTLFVVSMITLVATFIVLSFIG
jgi:hypothetical protein